MGKPPKKHKTHYSLGQQAEFKQGDSAMARGRGNVDASHKISREKSLRAASSRQELIDYIFGSSDVNPLEDINKKYKKNIDRLNDTTIEKTQKSEEEEVTSKDSRYYNELTFVGLGVTNSIIISYLLDNGYPGRRIKVVDQYHDYIAWETNFANKINITRDQILNNMLNRKDISLKDIGMESRTPNDIIHQVLGELDPTTFMKDNYKKLKSNDVRVWFSSKALKIFPNRKRLKLLCNGDVGRLVDYGNVFWGDYYNENIQ